MVGLVPDREELDRRKAPERARIAKPHRPREVGEVGRVHLVVAAATARRRPVGSIGRERDHDPETLRERSLHEVVVGLEARIGGRAGGVERGTFLRGRAGSDLAPLDLDSHGVGAQRANLVERLLAHLRSRADQVDVVLEHRPLGAARGGRGGRHEYAGHGCDEAQGCECPGSCRFGANRVRHVVNPLLPPRPRNRGLLLQRSSVRQVAVLEPSYGPPRKSRFTSSKAGLRTPVSSTSPLVL